MRLRKVATAALAVACLFGVAGVSATSAAATQSTANEADAEFVSMMIPHHFQALVMSRMAPERSANEDLLALADRIDVEQDLEISMMQSWQGWNGLEVTDAEESYEAVLQQPELLEQMGMATPAELDDLSAADGTAFDVLYLELMITHHEGALDMLVNVIINGSDPILEQWATEMLTTQYTQILQMEAMLEDLTS